MGTQRKNDATYSHPWRDYFPIERSNQTVVQLLKTRDVHLSAIRIWRGAAETGSPGNPTTLQGILARAEFAFHYKTSYCFPYLITTRKTETNQPHHCWCMDTTYNYRKRHFSHLCFLFLCSYILTPYVKNYSYQIQGVQYLMLKY